MRFSSALTAACLGFLLTGCDRGNHPQQVGKTAPEFSVHDTNASIDLQQYHGQVVVLNFWATWCAPCLEELPSLEDLQKKMPQVNVLAVSIDNDPEAYQKFLMRHPLALHSVRDGNAGANLKFGTVKVPETFIIDRNGVIQRKFIGPQDWTNPEILNYLSKL